MPLYSVKRIEYATRKAAFHNRMRCEAKVADSTARWRILANKDDQCELDAGYFVAGSFYCKRHAGDKLLSLFLDGTHTIEEK